MNRNIEQNIGLRPLLLRLGLMSCAVFRNIRYYLICTVLLPGCMIMPISENDFSMLKDDEISTFLKQTANNHWPEDPKQIDLAAFKKKSADFFYGKSSDFVKKYFASNNGECSNKGNELGCQCTREWQWIRTYQLFFGLFDYPDKHGHPKAMFLFDFKLNNNLVEYTEVEHKNLTYYISK